MFSKILVALDQASSNHLIFDHAVELAKSNHATLMLLHVLSPFDQDYPTTVYPSVDGIYIGLHEQAMQTYANQWKRYEQQGFEMLRSLQEEARSAGVTTEFTQNLGDPGRAICAVAQTWNADLILLGRRGRKGFSELFLGSVSNYVLHHAPCSVLTIQGQVQPQTPLESSDAVTVHS